MLSAIEREFGTIELRHVCIVRRVGEYPPRHVLDGEALSNWITAPRWVAMGDGYGICAR